MAHFAELDKNNKVLRVIVINNSDILDEDGNESEQIGIDFCKNLFGGNWIQTSYNNSFRFNFAGIDYTYDQEKDAFIPPKTFDSWILDESNFKWKAPISHPSDNKTYSWDEENKSWKEVIINE